MPKLEKFLSNWALDGEQEIVCRFILDNAGPRFTIFQHAHRAHHAQGLILEVMRKILVDKGLLRIEKKNKQRLQ